MPIFGDGSLRSFIDSIMRSDDRVMEKKPDEGSGNDPMVLHPDKARTDKQLADAELNAFGPGLPISFKQAEQGTLRNFLSRMISGDRERNIPGVEGQGTARSEELLSTPSKLQPQPNLQPKDYTITVMDPQSISELRASLYEQTGQGAVPQAASAAAVAEPNDPNSLQGRMSSPNAPAEMRGQMQEGQDISDRFSLTRKNQQSTRNPFQTLFSGRQT